LAKVIFTAAYEKFSSASAVGSASLANTLFEPPTSVSSTLLGT
jgi:hypothetical protein